MINWWSHKLSHIRNTRKKAEIISFQLCYFYARRTHTNPSFLWQRNLGSFPDQDATSLEYYFCVFHKTFVKLLSWFLLLLFFTSFCTHSLNFYLSHFTISKIQLQLLVPFLNVERNVDVNLSVHITSWQRHWSCPEINKQKSDPILWDIIKLGVASKALGKQERKFLNANFNQSQAWIMFSVSFVFERKWN